MTGLNLGLGLTKGAGEAPSAFLPTDIANLGVWFDASDTATITESSDLVSQINDKSGNGRNGTQSIEGDKPLTNTSTINSLNVLTYAGGQDSLDYDGTFLIGTDYTVFVVEKRTTLGVGWFCSGTVGSNNNNLLFGYTTSTNQIFSQWTNDLNFNDAGLNASVARAWTYSLDSTAGRELRLDNVSKATIVTTDQLTGYTNAAWGSTRIGLFSIIGDMAEFLVYTRNLSDTEKASIQTYFSRWGL